MFDGYRLGLAGKKELVEDLKAVLCCPGREQDCNDILARLAPYLIAAYRRNARSRRELEEILGGYFAWLGLRWAYRPCGPPPSDKEQMVIDVLMSAGLPLNEEFIKSLAPPGNEREGEESDEL